VRVLNKFIVQKHDNANVKEMFSVVKLVSDHTKQYTDAITFSIQSCRYNIIERPQQRVTIALKLRYIFSNRLVT
jgi:hypothetical protein